MKWFLIITLSLMTQSVFALTKEDIQRIKKQNAAADKAIREDPNGGLPYLPKSQVESSPVSQKQFKKKQAEIRKKQKKYSKHTPVAGSVTLISNPATKGKKYRIMIEAEKVNNASAFNGGYTFTYMNHEDTGFRHSGKGHYLLSCKSKKCFNAAYWDTETYTANDARGTFKKRDVLKINNTEAIVQFTGKTVSGVNGLGQKIVLPVLNMLEIY
ncbi:hypothetical protein OAT67_02330 [Bacteriovoracaceae bacterium]|nr:hypothetical protein [Bacteriovoracaceae bacterium]